MLNVAEVLYEAVLERRRRRLKARPPRRSPCKVVSVGNLSVGGTGKTPAVQYIARELQAEGGRVAVVARGYRGSLSRIGAVVGDGTQLLLGVGDAGDEPVLHAQALAGIPVLIGRDRGRAVHRAHTEFGTNVVVLDDAFQYWSLCRDLDIVLLDARRPFDNGHLLPAGRLRERPGALSRAGAIVLTRSDLATGDERKRARESISKYSTAPVWEARHAAQCLLGPGGEIKSVDSLRGARVGALCALADNEGFASSLRLQGAEVVSCTMRRDHHSWTSREVKRAVRDATQRGAEFLVTSEKDSVKLAKVKFQLPIYSLRIELQFLADEDEFKRLLLKLNIAGMRPEEDWKSPRQLPSIREVL